MNTVNSIICDELITTEENILNAMKEPCHAFNSGLARLYGAECAILITHFQYWINHNKRMGKNSRDGRTWTYQTRAEICNHFPYLSQKEVRNLLEKLVNFGVLIKGNYNRCKFDKTMWYAFKNEKIFTSDQKGRRKENKEFTSDHLEYTTAQKGQPIPHTIPHTETKEIHTPKKSEDNQSKKCVFFFCESLKKKDPRMKITEDQKNEWEKTFIKMHASNDFSWEEIIKIIEYSHNNEFWYSRTLTVKNLMKNAPTIFKQMQPYKKRNLAENLEHGRIYNGYECIIDNLGIGFENVKTKDYYGVESKSQGFKEKLASTIKRLGIIL